MVSGAMGQMLNFLEYEFEFGNSISILDFQHLPNRIEFKSSDDYFIKVVKNLAKKLNLNIRKKSKKEPYYIITSKA